MSMDPSFSPWSKMTDAPQLKEASAPALQGTARDFQNMLNQHFAKQGKKNKKSWVIK